MTLPEIITLTEIFPTTIFSVKIMHDCLHKPAKLHLKNCSLIFASRPWLTLCPPPASPQGQNVDQLKCGRLVPEGEGDTKPTAIVYVGTSDRYEMMIKLTFPQCSRIFTYKYDQQRTNSISSRLLFDSFIF